MIRELGLKPTSRNDKQILLNAMVKDISTSIRYSISQAEESCTFRLFIAKKRTTKAFQKLFQREEDVTQRIQYLFDYPKNARSVNADFVDKIEVFSELVKHYFHEPIMFEGTWDSTIRPFLYEILDDLLFNCEDFYPEGSTEADDTPLVEDVSDDEPELTRVTEEQAAFLGLGAIALVGYAHVNGYGFVFDWIDKLLN